VAGVDDHQRQAEESWADYKTYVAVAPPRVPDHLDFRRRALMPNAPIQVRRKVTATLDLSPDASGPAQLMIAHPSGVDAVSVAPGASGTVGLTPTSRGILKVLVDMSGEADAGTLVVAPPGPSGPVTGDRVESYVVVRGAS
jgi:hypothetical protein